MACVTGVAAVGVDEEGGVVADGLPRQVDAVEVTLGAGAPRLGDLDLDLVATEIEPALQLLAEPCVVVGGETAAAVDLDGRGRRVLADRLVARLARRAQQVDDRLVLETGREVPEGDVHRGDRHPDQPRPTGVAHRADHGLPRPGDVERVMARDGRCEQLLDDRGGRAGRVGPPDAGAVGRLGLDHDQRGAVPGQGAVGLGCVGGHRVGRGADPGEARAGAHESPELGRNSWALVLMPSLMTPHRLVSPLIRALAMSSICSRSACGGIGGMSGSQCTSST